MKSEREIFFERVKQELEKGKKILNLGCYESYSSNNVQIDLTNEGYDCVGVDIMPASYVDVVTNLNHKFPFEDNSYDMVLAMEIIEHVHSPFFFLEECFRVLKPGGKLILTTPHAPSIIQFMQTYEPFYKDLDEHPHLFYLDKHCAKRILQEVGFKNISAELHGAHYCKNLFMRLLQKLIIPFRSNMLVIAWKLN